MLILLVPGLGLGLVASMTGVGEFALAAGTVANATTSVSNAFANVAVATSTGVLNVAYEARR